MADVLAWIVLGIAGLGVGMLALFVIWEVISEDWFVTGFLVVLASFVAAVVWSLHIVGVWPNG